MDKTWKSCGLVDAAASRLELAAWTPTAPATEVHRETCGPALLLSPAPVAAAGSASSLSFAAATILARHFVMIHLLRRYKNTLNKRVLFEY